MLQNMSIVGRCIPEASCNYNYSIQLNGHATDWFRILE